MPYNSQITRNDAAALIPEDVSNQILRNITTESAALSLFPKVQMSSSQMRMPVLAALPTAYWVTGDTGLKQTTNVNWDNTFLNVEELAAIVPIPEAVFDDITFNVWDRIAPLIEGAMHLAIDNAIFFGVNKPSSWPDAIVQGATAVNNVKQRIPGNASAPGPDIASDFNDLFSLVEQHGFDVDFILAHRTFKAKLRDARSVAGWPIPSITNETAFGVPVRYPLRGLWPTGAGAVEAIVGNSQEAIVGVRQDMTMKVLDQAVIQDVSGAIVYNLAQQDMIALRVVMRLAWAVANSITYDQPDKSKRYPFAIMKAPTSRADDTAKTK